MERYRVFYYDHFFRTGYDLKGVWFFETLKEAEKFLEDREEAKRRWPKTFGDSEYVLVLPEDQAT